MKISKALNMNSWVKLTTIIFILSFYITCSKVEILDELQFQKTLLSGTGSFDDMERIWKVDSIKINGEGLNLSNSQLKYTKTFKFQGGFLDSDGQLGTWEMPSLTVLEISILNTKTEKSLSYEIKELNSIKLDLELQDGSDRYEYFFILRENE
jgi:hypothetical protein